MNARHSFVYALLILSLAIIACSMGKRSSEPTVTNQSNQGNQSPSQKAESSPKTTEPGQLQPGQASGSYTAKGETVELKYAYAGHGVRFGNESIIVLVTDKPIPPEAVAEEIKSQTLLGDEKIRGLEYVFEKDGHWVRYHPSQYQESTNKPLKEYMVENGVVKGFDDDKGDTTDGKYSRSVRFAAALIKD
jgi:hypothetical protein